MANQVYIESSQQETRCKMKHSEVAITAARNYLKWGRYAAINYVIKHGCPPRLYYLARVLEAAQKVRNLDPIFLQRQAY